MKKLAAMLLAAALMTAFCACALTGSGYPAWDGAALPQNALYGYIGEHPLSLEFDPAQDYSYFEDSLLTACFFAFDQSEQNYLEMYLVMPESSAAGDVYSAGDGNGSSSISLYEVSREDESLYYAGQLIGMPYPSGSEYEITIESAVQENGSLRISGSLYATLGRIENGFAAEETLTLKNVSFQFSMPIQEDQQPRESAQPFATLPPEATQPPFSLPGESPSPLPEATPKAKAPAYTMDPHPAFTLPPDYRVI